MYFRAVIGIAISAGSLLADFKYDQTTRMTGGSMLGMMRMVSRGATDNVVSTIAIKGDKMVTRMKDSANIVDLAAETFTDVNFKNQTYTVMTFAQLKEQLEKLTSKGQPQSGNMNLSVDVKETGKTATLNGVPATEWLLTMVFEGSGADGNKGQMRMEMSNWIAKGEIAGYREVIDFQKKMAEKIGMLGAGSPFRGALAQPGMAKGMAEMTKKMADMGGFPVVSIMRTVPGNPEQIKQMEEAQQSQKAHQEANPAPTPGEAAAQGVAGQLGRLGIGGLGGRFGRKKKEAPAEQSTAATPAPAASAPAAASKAPVEGSFTSTISLIEMTTEASNFSNASVDESLFAVPAGFKQVTPKDR